MAEIEKIEKLTDKPKKNRKSFKLYFHLFGHMFVQGLSTGCLKVTGETQEGSNKIDFVLIFNTSKY